MWRRLERPFLGGFRGGSPTNGKALRMFPLLLMVLGAEGKNALVRFRRGTNFTIPMPDTLGELDDWSIFDPGYVLLKSVNRFSCVLVLAFIGLGAAARTSGSLDLEDASMIRSACFTLLLPAFLLRHIWLCQLEAELYGVAAWSVLFHGLWFGLSWKAASILEPSGKQMRGWTMLISQGATNSFLYPLLLSSRQFGERSLACAVLWDLGGNMWICQFALFAIAAYFRPGSNLEDLGRGELGDDEENESFLLTRGEDMEHSEPVAHDDASDFMFESSKKSSKPIEPCLGRFEALPILLDALRQPVLGACVFGFLLNIARVPLPQVADTPLWALGEPYKIVLYFLVGYYGDHRVGAMDASRMIRALGTRYAISVAIIVAALVVLPFELMYRQTIALALLSPSSSYLIHLVGEHGYGEAMLKLTVCAGFVSTVVSTIAQNLLLEFFQAIT